MDYSNDKLDLIYRAAVDDKGHGGDISDAGKALAMITSPINRGHIHTSDAFRVIFEKLLAESRSLSGSAVSKLDLDELTAA